MLKFAGTGVVKLANPAELELDPAEAEVVVLFANPEVKVSVTAF
jgi:hypothetical protein